MNEYIQGSRSVWYIDYMFPHNEEPAWSELALKTELREDWALEDGQIYIWDIRFVKYMAYSDHYDKDHYDYYTRYMPNFLTGSSRENNNLDKYYATKQDIERLEEEASSKRDKAFNKMVDCFKKLPFLDILRAVNARPDCVHKMERLYDWSSVIRSLGATPEHIFTAKLIIAVKDDNAFHGIVSKIPQGNGGIFRLAKVLIYTPDGISNDTEELIYDLEIAIFPDMLCNEFFARDSFDAYFDAISKVLGSN